MKRKSKKEEFPLSIYEANVLLPILVTALKTKKGKANAVKSRQMVEALRYYGIKLTDKQVFKLVNYIRMNDLIVGLRSSSAGYYIISSEQDFIYYEDILQSREAALKKLRLCMKRQRKSMLSHLSQKQTRLLF